MPRVGQTSSMELASVTQAKELLAFFVGERNYDGAVWAAQAMAELCETNREIAIRFMEVTQLVATSDLPFDDRVGLESQLSDLLECRTGLRCENLVNVARMNATPLNRFSGLNFDGLGWLNERLGQPELTATVSATA